ncbi:MAG: NAD(P)-dependent alcohol dehydrogenase, partial [Acidocella sp.]|nr:NAD(P)-dependent alcohol dehydrogenase [Acidocella sp.]
VKMIGSKFPRAMGLDFSGIVEETGPGVSHFQPGDEVIGSVSYKVGGAFATHVIASQEYLVRKPANLSFAEGSCLPVAGATAWVGLVQYSHLAPGQRVFINGAMGAVGQAAVSIARGIGAAVVGRVGPRSIDKAQSLGLTSSLDYSKPLPDSLDGSFDVVLDCNGSLSVREEERLRKPTGMIIDVVPSPSKFLRALISRSRKVILIDPKATILQSVVDLAAATKLSVPVAKMMSLAEAPAVMAALERGERIDGKAVIAL